MTDLSSAREVAVDRLQSQKAATIYQYSRACATSLLGAFDESRKARGNPRGATTDAEQDILRAMLVMTASGLDALLKQLVRDCLPVLAGKDRKVREGLEKFVQRQIRGEGESLEPSGAKFLGRILASPAPHASLVEEYVKELTGDSLQSSDQIMTTVAALGLDSSSLDLRPKDLRAIFEVRNKIIHELDIDLDGTRRKRNQRKVDDMAAYADLLMNTGEVILRNVDQKV